MKKAGVISFICYLIYLLYGGGQAIYSYVMAQKISESGGWEGLGHAIVMILAIILAGVGLIGVILKGIHLKTEWGFFGVLCILFDLAFAAVLVTGVMSNDGLADNDPTLLFVFAIPVAVTFVCNILSMKKVISEVLL